MMNYRPEDFDIWVPYSGWRYKDYHDLKLKTGEVVLNYYPNGNSWFSYESDVRFNDDDVAEIRLIPDERLHRYAFSGSTRIERNLDMFSGSIPERGANT